MNEEPSIASILHKFGILSKEEKEENEKKEKYANTFTKEKLGKAWKASKEKKEEKSPNAKWINWKNENTLKPEKKMGKAKYIDSKQEPNGEWTVTLELNNGKRTTIRGKGADLDRKMAEVSQKEKEEEYKKSPDYAKIQEYNRKMGKMGVSSMPADQKKSIDPKLNAMEPKMAKDKIPCKSCGKPFSASGHWETCPSCTDEAKKSSMKKSFSSEIKKKLDDLVRHFDDFTTSDLQGAVGAIAMQNPGEDEDEMLSYIYEKTAPGHRLGKARAVWKAYRTGKAATQEEKDKEKKEHPEFPKKDTDRIAEDHDKLGKDNCMVCGTKTPGNLCPKCMKKPVGEMGKAMMPTWIEDEILAAVTKFNDEQKALSYVLRQSNVQEAIVDGYTNENDIKKQLKQELAFNKKEAAHEKRIEHGDCTEKKFAQHSLQPKDYATMEAKFLKEGDYHEKGGLLCKYSWDVLNACKDTFKGKAFYIEHANEKLGSEYGTIDEVEARTIDGENWLVARMKVPETDFTKGILDRIENGLIKNVSSAHELFVDLAEPGNRVRRMSGRAISLVKEGEVPGAEIMNIKRHAAG